MKSLFWTLMLVAVAMIAGCNGSDTEESAAPEPEGAAATSVDSSAFVLEDEPEGAQDILAARELVGNEEDVVLVGRIGGSVNPWVEGRAVFSIVDTSLKACNDTMEDHCPTPWDYCCAANLPEATALVKLVGDDENVVKADARDVLPVEELDTVVVRGKAQRDDAGNLTVLAKGVFVR